MNISGHDSDQTDQRNNSEKKENNYGRYVPQPTMVVVIHSLRLHIFFSAPTCVAISSDGNWTGSVKSGRMAQREKSGTVAAGQVSWVSERSFIFAIKQGVR